MIALATLLVGVSLGLPSFAAAWATPGAACTQEGANANSDGFLTCTGGVWVSNAVLLGTTSATCDSTKAGYIRYTGGQFEGCNGTGWIQLAGGGKATYLGVTPSSYNGSQVGGFTGANAKCVAAFGAGARIMTMGDFIKMGKTTNYPANAWFDCRDGMSLYAASNDYVYFYCGESQTAWVNSPSCSSFTLASVYYSGFSVTTGGSILSITCDNARQIHCVKD